MNDLIKFFPSFVGSKAQWIKHEKLREATGLRENHIVELFCGSAVISASLAKSSLLVDIDPIICKVLTRFDEQIVPEVFTVEDYFEKREAENWWQYTYCLQKMSFSGVFRYNAAKNKYNVPIKKNKDGTYYLTEISIRDEYLIALNRWKELNPGVINLSYLDIPIQNFKNAVVIFDPPYEGSQASYNKEFDYRLYWQIVERVREISKRVVVFDRVKNLQENLGDVELYTRKMRVNGKYAGDEEGMCILG